MTQSVVAGYELKDQGLIPNRGGDSSLCHQLQTGSGTHQASWGVEVLSSEAKWPQHESNSSPPSSSKV